MSKVLLATQWGICCQELTPVDETSYHGGPLFLTHELVFKGPMLPTASCSYAPFKIDGECNLQLELVVTQEGGAVSSVSRLFSFCSCGFHLKGL